MRKEGFAIISLVLLVALFLVVGTYILYQKNLSLSDFTNLITTNKETKTQKLDLGTIQIAYLKSAPDSQDQEIWTVNLDGTNNENTGTVIKEGIILGSFNMSPNLDNACYIASENGEEEVYLYDVRSNQIEKISDSFFEATPTHDGSDLSFCFWSRDGKYFAYRVSHDPHEYIRGVPVSKLPPPEEYKDKMGGFIYDVYNNKIEKHIEEDKITSFSSTWRPSGDNWKLNPLNYFLKNEHEQAYIFYRELRKASENIYTTDSYSLSAHPLIASPNNNKIAFVDSDKRLVVFEVGPEKHDSFKKYEDTAEINPYYTFVPRFIWLSEDYIIFWKEKAWTKTNSNNGPYILNTITGEVNDIITNK
ncbi:MAG: hypothetical protein KGD64_13595 [Candidatus Heimdallarchaeota archaeon]|nr:hypothetical protein [Candidatus Heimdallarchaeota archaeon]